MGTNCKVGDQGPFMDSLKMKYNGKNGELKIWEKKDKIKSWE